MAQKMVQTARPICPRSPARPVQDTSHQAGPDKTDSRPNPRKRIACIFGTRPEAIKMAPVVQALARAPGLTPQIIVTGQHRDMLDQALQVFGLRPDADLDVMRPGQDPASLTAAILTGLGPVLADLAPDYVLVHGDTATTLSASLAAFYARIPIGHVEAGLRTGTMTAPWPEEMNRRVTAQLADLHFAPTDRTAGNLIAEGVAPAQVSVTGNTAIDALAWVKAQILDRSGADAAMAQTFPWLDPKRRLILVTGHRRENQDGGLARLAAAVLHLAARHDVQIVWPVHPSPKVRTVIEAMLGGAANVHLMEPLEYVPFAWAMARAALIITDSGGIQEEAPSLGTPVLVTRDVTERQEAVAAGTVRLTGTDPTRILAEATRLLDSAEARQAMASSANPYGDGQAAQRIVARLRTALRQNALEQDVLQDPVTDQNADQKTDQTTNGPAPDNALTGQGRKAQRPTRHRVAQEDAA